MSMVRIYEMMDDDENSNESSSDEDQPMCRYGASCYRKNPDHKKQFRHPDKITSATNTGPDEKVKLNIEIGHRTILKTKGPQGISHEWTAFVQGVDSSKIEHFVAKVVFNLPECFPNRAQVVNETPFEISESSKDSFVMTIDVYFKSSEESKITFLYDLHLRPSSSFTNVRLEKLTFRNPEPELRRRLLEAGGQLESNSGNIQPDSSTGRNEDRQAPSSSTGKRNASSVSCTDEYDAFSQSCASKLRKLEGISPTQKVIAEKLISDVLYNAQLKLLTTESCILSMSQSSGSAASRQTTEKQDEVHIKQEKE